MHFPSNTKYNNKAPSNGGKTHRKINFSTISLFNHNKAFSSLTKNVNFKAAFKLFLRPMCWLFFKQP